MSHVAYLQHFGLRSAPFHAASDFASLYMSGQHQEALAHLAYGTSTDCGIVLLTGDIGTGKSCLCRLFLKGLPSPLQAAYIEHPGSDARSLLAAICGGLRLQLEPSSEYREYLERLNSFQLDVGVQGGRVVLVIDNAQLLNPDALEQLRLLTNLQPRGCAPLQIVIVGQTGLRELLARPELRQLSQRVVARYHLGPLPRRDALDYARHRLTMAGADAAIVPQTLSWPLHRMTAGVPRNINHLCDRALHICAARQQAVLDSASLRQAGQEVGLGKSAGLWPLDPRMAALPLAVVAASALAISISSRYLGPDITPASLPASHVALAPAAPAPASPTTLPDALPINETAITAPVLVAGWPTDSKPASGSSTAYASLSQRWGDSALVWRDCDKWRHADLRCLRSRGDLHDLRDLNLPAVLHLSDKQAWQADALLLAIDTSSVLLRLGDVEHRVSPAELGARWQGDYTVLLRRSPGLEGPLRIGSRGPGVSWLREQLAAASGVRATTRGAKHFDAGLQRQVRQFQRAEKLEPDGVAGVKTLIRLAQRNDAHVPRLADASRRQVDGVGPALPKAEGRSNP